MPLPSAFRRAIGILQCSGRGGTGCSPSLHPALKKDEARAGPALSVFTTARLRDEFTAELRLVCQR